MGSYFAFGLCLNNFFRKRTSQSLTLSEREEDRPSLSDLELRLKQGKEVAIVSMFSDNVQYQIRQPLKALLITNEEKQLLERVFTDRELDMIIGRKVITTPLDATCNIVKNKLACFTEMVLSLDKLDNNDNMEDGRLSNILLRYHMTGSKEFTHFEPVTHQYKRRKNREFILLTLRITDQKDNGTTDGPDCSFPH